MRVLICGSRDWSDPTLLRYLLDGIEQTTTPARDTLEVIHGNARGADSMAGSWARDAMTRNGLVWEHSCPANWNGLGNAAGPIRNKVMLALGPDLVVGFSDDLETSRGTRHMLTIASAALVPTYHIRQVQGYQHG